MRVRATLRCKASAFARTLNLDKTQPSIFRFRLALIQEYRRGLEEGLDLGAVLKIPPFQREGED